MVRPIQPPVAASGDRAPLIVGVVSMLLLLGTVTVSMRIYTRKILMDNMGFDDWLIICGLLATWGSGIAVISNIKYGAGKHLETLDQELMPLYMRCFYVSIVLYILALAFIKTTFLAQYYRVFFTQKSRRIFFLISFLVCGWSISQVFIGIFLCFPIQGFWDKSIDARCIPTNVQWYANAAGNIATDLIVFILPLPVIGQLNLPRTQKIFLFVLFGLGFLTVAISVIRIQYLKVYEDLTWENVAPACWSVAELTTAIICASLSTLRPFMARHFPGLISQHSARRSSYVRQDSDSRLKQQRNRALASIGTSAERREVKDEHNFFKQHGYELSMHLSQHSSTESMIIRQPERCHAPRSKSRTEYEQALALRMTTTTEVESTASGGHSQRSNTPSGPWILVQHDVLQTNQAI
ncbi:Satratoxin biosynthesis SC10 cluster protein [Paramyrothecium foliicola]|nr:Satratoxin biosynthesis SC10 cluster protein [Paramyrothecium foliicola]